MKEREEAIMGELISEWGERIMADFVVRAIKNLSRFKIGNEENIREYVNGEWWLFVHRN